MWDLVVGSFLLSLVHAVIPSHWLPVVAIARNEKWSKTEATAVTTLAGVAHVLSTILIGVLIGMLGIKIAEFFAHDLKYVAPAVLILVGLYYLAQDLRHGHRHCHPIEVDSKSNRSKTTLVISLCIAMFFSPCFEIEAYYLVAAQHGWLGIMVVSIVFLLVTVIGMVALVSLALAGVTRIKWNLAEHHEQGVSGAILIALGILALFLGHHHHV